LFKRKFDNIVQADSEGNAKLPEKHHHHQVNINSKAVVKAENMNTVKLESSSKVSSGRIVVRGLASMSEWKEMKRKGKKVDFNAQLDIEVRISYNHFSSFWVMFVFMSFGYVKSVVNLLLMHVIHC